MPPEVSELVRRLYERRGDGVVVPFVEVSMDGWTPEEKWCHRNVDLWVLANPACRAVRGWIVFDMHESSQGLLPIARFEAHSVVEQEDGSWVDITPSRASQRYPFLRHEGNEDKFVELVEGGYFSLVWRVG